MSDMKFDYSQRMQQQLKLSPQMIQAVELLRLPVEELCDRVYQEAEKNPAIEVVKDADLSIRSASPTNTTKYSNASDSFQSFLENTADHEESLQEHLLFQLHLLGISDKEKNLGERIIQNLDVHGFFSASLEKLLYPDETYDSLKKMLSVIRSFDPQGIGFSNVQESLLYQAELLGECSELTLEILKNHFTILEKKRPPLIAKYLNELNVVCTVEEVEKSLECIRTLNPYPASQFNAVDSSVHYVIPEVTVRKKIGNDDTGEQSSNGFEIEFLKGSLPDITLSSMYTDLLDEKSETKENKKFLKESVHSAKQFINALNYRTESIFNAIQVIVLAQHDFFEKGPGHLVPLRLKDVSEKIGVHEATISRISNGKYLQCDWGIFEIKYFFTNAVHTQKEDNHSTVPDSKESIKHALLQILQEHGTSNGKKLSDSKLVQKLEEKGIHIARRTVAKYRSELNIESSFDRL